MKKFLTIFSALFLLIASNVDAAEPQIYLKNTKVQQGTEATIDLYLSTENAIGSIYVEYSLPDGVTLNSVTSEGASVTPNLAKKNFLLGKGTPYFTTGVAATLNVTVAADAELGDHAMTLTLVQAAQPDLTTYTLTNVENTLTIQKEAVIEDQDADYAFEIIPFATTAGQTYASGADNSIEVPVLLKNADYVSAASFALTLPTGFGIASYKSGMKTTTKQPVVNTTRSYNVSEDGSTSALSFTQSKTDQVVTYTLGSTGDGDYVESGSGEIAKVYLTTTADLADGVYTLKISNISITSTPDGETYTTHTGGEYYFSVFVGTPTETDPIVYGHYTTEGKAALMSAVSYDATTKLPNFRTVDMKVATVDDENPAISDVLVNGPAKTSYYRSVSNISTICLPYALTSDDNVQYYALESIDEVKKLMTFTAVDNVAANTPALFKGTINAGVTGYVYPDAEQINEVEVGDYTLVGTYETYNLASGNGYYLANGKFYGDGATVAPFRACIDTSTSVDVKVFDIAIEDASGIHIITDQLSNEDIYNLQGIRMQNTQKGVNIVGGKKVYIKK